MALLLAISACFSFSIGSAVFTKFSKKISPLWMNFFKLLIATGVFLLLGLVFWKEFTLISSTSLVLLLVSGIIGLFMGDQLLLSAFKKIGASRTLVVFSFQPIFISIWAFLILGQKTNSMQYVAVFFLVLCIFFISFENFEKSKNWEIKGLSMALGGVLLDGIGVTLTRLAFDKSPEIGSIPANLIRCVGALVMIFLYIKIKKRPFLKHFKNCTKSERYELAIGSSLGTFVSLSLWLQAIKIGHLTSVTAAAGTSPIFSAVIEMWQEKKAPSKYLLASLLSLFTGLYILAVNQ